MDEPLVGAPDTKGRPVVGTPSGPAAFPQNTPNRPGQVKIACMRTKGDSESPTP